MTERAATEDLRQAGSYTVTKPVCPADPAARLYFAKHGNGTRVVTLQELWVPGIRDVEGINDFVAIARSGHRVRGPHLIEINEFLEASTGQYVCVLEALFGETLRSRVNRGAVTLTDAIDIVGQLGQALGVIHAAGKVHACLAISRVFLGEGAPGTINVKLFDYGAGPEQSLLLESSELAPDQRGGSTASVLTDVYLLATLAAQIVPSGKVPDALREVLDIGQSIRPEDRYRSVEQLCTAIVDSLDPSKSTAKVAPELELARPVGRTGQSGVRLEPVPQRTGKSSTSLDPVPAPPPARSPGVDILGDELELDLQTWGGRTAAAKEAVSPRPPSAKSSARPDPVPAEAKSRPPSHPSNPSLAPVPPPKPSSPKSQARLDALPVMSAARPEPAAPPPVEVPPGTDRFANVTPMMALLGALVGALLLTLAGAGIYFAVRAPPEIVPVAPPTPVVAPAPPKAAAPEVEVPSLAPRVNLAISGGLHGAVDRPGK